MKKVTLILLIIFFTGLSVLLYPSISQFYNAKKESKAISNYESFISKIDSNVSKKMIEEANKYNEELYKLEFPLLEYYRINNYNKVLNINDSGMIGYVSIDKLRLEIPIYHGTSSEVLNSAAGHIEGSSFPVGGANTHSIISAHRGLPSSKLFTDLDKLEVGDIFTISCLDQVYTYQIDQIKIVDPDDLRDINIIEDGDYVTLLTCTPYGINTHRLLVRGKRIENIEAKRLFVTAEAYQVDKLIVTSFIALPILLSLIIYIVVKPSQKSKGGNLYEE